jgi:hypothetical protein
MFKTNFSLPLQFLNAHQRVLLMLWIQSTRISQDLSSTLGKDLSSPPTNHGIFIS